ncbi:MAG TPA: tRNA pseudouridine(38-40) synthase TruA [Candidatus Hydrogenedens sp.]|nr:tRNA pseudouridine(38-40) synthase TruA [Candidatus Hydrogenedens sp.]HPP58540.1 tRNA pseudouridine(38-40) synthase TruA [Candidatus Hydrogenedens sp.]
MDNKEQKKQYIGVIRYDGSAFHGWQFQPNLPTVQGTVEQVLSLITRQPIQIQGASRTDTGVHALGQVFSFFFNAEIPKRLRHSASQLLSPNAQITNIKEVPLEFDVCRDVKWKKYCYTIDLGKESDPFAHKYAWHIPYNIDLELLQKLFKYLIGTHDFRGFQSTGSQMTSTIRTLYSIQLKKGGVIGPIDSKTLYHIEYIGNGFLYHMVRNITGTLIEIARGKQQPDFLIECLELNKKFKGLCAPPQGLTLAQISYEPFTHT